MTESDFSARVAAVAESKTTQVFTLARQLQQQGKDIISLAVGEPDFKTPDPVIQATRQALAEQATRYGPVAGIEALRCGIAEQFKGYSADNILVANGAKQALFSIFQVLCNPGDEVIVPQPCWVSFTEQIKLAGARPVLVPTCNQQLDPAAIQRAITPRTRAILINSPNNPTGAVYTADAMAAAARMAAAAKIHLISDEAYHAFTYDGCQHVSALSVAEAPQWIITVRSFSKHYNMTGFRLGYVAASADIIQALTKLQGHLCGNVCTFAQHGAVAALAMDQAVVQERCAILQQRRDIAYAHATTMFGCVKPQGAFYLFADVSSHLKKEESSATLAMRLLTQAGVAVVPGEAFSGAGHIRISFGAGEAILKEGFERIKRAL
jgi:aspartate aminotransferase